jgi:hypothetical protein
MDFTDVKSSSNISGVHHDTETSVLHVKFKNGGVYRYHGVTADKHAEMMKSASIGAFLHQHIKGNHPYSKVESE